jgi:hypothetical protein
MWKNVWAKNAYFNGNVDFTGANVSGLDDFALKTHNHDSDYLKVLKGTASASPPNLGSLATAIWDVSVSGAAPGDPCSVSYTNPGGGAIQLTCYVSASNNVKVIYHNAGSVPIDWPAGTFNVAVRNW